MQAGMLKNAGMLKSSRATSHADTMLQAFSIIVCVWGRGSVVWCEDIKITMLAG